MKVAVIGCGTIANAAHIPAYMKNTEAEIKYFCDIIPERARQAVEKYGCGMAVTDYHEVISDPEITAVSICTPNNVHPQIAIDAMLYILDKRLFEDGDIRVALMFANKIMLENGCGVITVPPMYDDDFREHLQKLNVTRDSEPFKNWVFKCCLRGERMS